MTFIRQSFSAPAMEKEEEGKGGREEADLSARRRRCALGAIRRLVSRRAADNKSDVIKRRFSRAERFIPRVCYCPDALRGCCEGWAERHTEATGEITESFLGAGRSLESIVWHRGRLYHPACVCARDPEWCRGACWS